MLARRLIPRLSLLTALLLITIAASAIGIWKLYAEVVPLRAENRRLRDELGELSVEDVDKFYAILTPEGEPDKFRYKWRIWVPKGRKYLLYCASSKISSTGISRGEAGQLADRTIG